MLSVVIGSKWHVDQGSPCQPKGQGKVLGEEVMKMKHATIFFITLKLYKEFFCLELNIGSMS
jgi:hypothetical protein